MSKRPRARRLGIEPLPPPRAQPSTPSAADAPVPDHARRVLGVAHAWGSLEYFHAYPDLRPR